MLTITELPKSQFQLKFLFVGDPREPSVTVALSQRCGAEEMAGALRRFADALELNARRLYS